MDRTAEFTNTVAAVREHGGAAPSALAQLAAASGSARVPPLPPLARSAGDLARAVRRVARLAARLHTLAQLRGLFNDPGAEVNELSALLRGELAALDAGVGALAASAAREAEGGSGCGPRAHWVAVADALRAHVLGLTRTFQAALRARAATLADTSSRRRAFAHSTWAPTALPLDSPLFASPSVGGVPAASLSAPAAPMGDDSTGGGDVTSAPGGEVVGGSSSPPLVASAYLKQRRRTHVPALGAASVGGAPPPPRHGVGGGGGGGGGGAWGVPPPAGLPPVSGSYSFSAQSLAVMHDARARAADMRAVEGAIVELGGLFTRMTSLVAEQGDTLARIDADMEEATANVEAGAAELGSYYRSIKANRSFILKLFGVLAFVIVLFGIFR